MKTMKRFAMIIFAMLVLIAALTLSVSAEDNIVDYLTYEINNGEVTITGCDIYVTGEIVIPDTIEGYPVKALGDLSFANCRAEKVIIPYGVREIRSFAFGYCENLEEIVIPESVEIIEDSFWGCPLKSVTIPGGVKKLGDYAFLLCTKLESVVVSEGVMVIGEGAFDSCRSLKNVDLPDSLTTIGDRAFSDCRNLESIVIPKNVRNFGDSVFYSCDSLVDIVISDDIEIIPPGLYKGIFAETMIKDFILSENVKRIETSAFEETSFKSVSFSENVEFIGEKAFFNCLFMDHMVIKNKNAVIEDKAIGYTNIIVTGDRAEFLEILEEMLGLYREEKFDTEKFEVLKEKLKLYYTLSEEAQPDPFFTLYGYKDSTAEIYAKENNIKFVAICEHEYIDTVITPATEDSTGVGGKVCTFCGDIIDKYDIPMIENDAESNKPTLDESLSFIDKIIAFFYKIINFFKNIKWLS